MASGKLDICNYSLASVTFIKLNRLRTLAFALGLSIFLFGPGTASAAISTIKTI